MVASITVSFDCEGKWGIADRGKTRLSEIESSKLNTVYLGILETLEKYCFPASFAFVAAFVQDKECLNETLASLKGRVIYRGKDWLAPAADDVGCGLHSGWSEPQLLSMVLDRGIHHVCSHGGFHLPYDEEFVSKESIFFDIEEIKKMENRTNLLLDYIIFPRNLVGFKEELAGKGIYYYRDVDKYEKMGGKKAKLIRLVNEFVSYDRKFEVNSQAAGPMIPTSSAKFLSARIGVRKLVPAAVTKRRMQALVDSAIKNGANIHLYSHPHNFISDPGMYEKLEWIASLARKYQDKGLLRIVTMEDERDEHSSAV